MAKFEEMQFTSVWTTDIIKSMRNNVGWMEADENTFCAQLTEIEEICHPRCGYLHRTKFILMCLWSEGQGLDERLNMDAQQITH